MGVKSLHSDVFWLADNHHASYLSNQSWHWKQSSLACTSFSAVSARPKYFFRTSSWRKALQSYVLRLAKKCHATFLSNQNWNWKQSSLACTSFPALGAHFIHKVRIDWLWTDSLRCDWTTTKFALLKWCWLRTAGVSVLRAARAASKMGIASPRSLSHSSLIAWAAAACLLATASSAFTT